VSFSDGKPRTGPKTGPNRIRAFSASQHASHPDAQPFDLENEIPGLGGFDPDLGRDLEQHRLLAGDVGGEVRRHFQNVSVGARAPSQSSQTAPSNTM
jgi:hypothetical protein